MSTIIAILFVVSAISLINFNPEENAVKEFCRIECHNRKAKTYK